VVNVLNWKSEVERYKFQEGLSWTETARKVQHYFPDLTEVQVREKIRAPFRKYKHNTRPNAVQSKFIIKGDMFTYEDTLEVIDGREITPEIIMEAHKLNPDEWQVVSFCSNVWQQQTKGGGKINLCQSKLTVRPKVTTFNPEWVKETIKDLKLPSPLVKRRSYQATGKTLEISIADAHINKLSIVSECGDEYSTKAGIKNLHNIIEQSLEKTSHYPIKKIIFPFGQDMANIDNLFRTTTKGTPQDTDTSYPDMYQSLLTAAIQIVHRLTEVAPVEVIYVGGNHDKLTSYTMTTTMYWHFLNNKNVEVDTEFYPRKYRLIGYNLLGLGHGEEEKKRIYNCMQNDVPQLWGQAKYREFHLSHIHTEKMIDEDNGTIFRWLSSPSPKDNWTNKAGYVGAQRKAQCFVWDDEGLEAIINCYV
jgi:hypothetical protein